jgi:hypothetical protein
MSCNGTQGCECGCCAGIAVETPQGEYNLPGLPAIAYRTGTWATFRESMLAGLSNSKYPALGALKTRDTDDLSIALLDATAVMLDILTFYQERLANESYLRTATQLDSLTQLSRLIGYQPSPGVGASTYLAFTLKAATGLPTNPMTTAITIPAGTNVQSVPGQGQTPQGFQTSADILAKPDWNALPVQAALPWVPVAGQTSVYLAGTNTQLNPGDAILIVGDERLLYSTSSTKWDLCFVTSVQPDNVNQRTLVTWSTGLGSTGGPSTDNPQVFALRQRAALFGYNAMNPIMLTGTTVNLGSLVTDGEWNFGTAAESVPTEIATSPSNLIDLDAVYSKLVAGGWLVLMATLPMEIIESITTQVYGYPPVTTTITTYDYASGFFTIELYNISSVTTMTRSDYGLSAKISRVGGDSGANLPGYYTATRSTAALAQSEMLPVEEQPLDHPLYGTEVDLGVLRPDLVGITAIAVTGQNPKLTVNVPGTPPTRGSVTFVPDDDSGAAYTLAQGAILTLLQPPNAIVNGAVGTPSWATYPGTPTLMVADSSGRTGTVTTALSNFILMPAAPSDPIVQETALVASITMQSNGVEWTQILLQAPLLNVYDRTGATVNCNVGAATAGSPVTELLGNGSAATPNQTFVLKQSPLTYVTASTPTGSVSSLQVTANGAAWTAVPTLYNQKPSAQVYATTNLAGGTAQVTFGDGVEGATLPTGQNNIQASYRVGLGSAGNVPAATITTLVDRPVGVGGVTNPLPATGGQDAQTVAGIRANAPLSVLTLGRAVSIADYQNFANSFAGIGKASALWIPNGTYRGVFLTVASASGAALPSTSQTLTNLVTALQQHGNPNVAIYSASFLETTFGLQANILYDPAYSQPAVEAAVMTLLATTYSFANRTFGQGVTFDEIAALIQGVAGVIAVNVTSLSVVATSPAGDIGSAAFSLSAYTTWLANALTTPLERPCPSASQAICPYIPQASNTALPQPAEILVLDPNPANVSLGVMS